jgi:hypothetical protein
MREDLELGLSCPLSDEEIDEWASKLGPKRSRDRAEREAREDRLRAIVADVFDAARSLYVVRTLPPNWPDAPVRVDKLLPDIACRLDAIRDEISRLPGAVIADLRVRFAKYDEAMIAAAALSEMLRQVAAGWYKPRPGQPSLESEAEVVGLLIHGVVQFTGEQFFVSAEHKA